MQTEELGSVYEGLLELTPRLADTGRAMTFAEGVETKGNERKTSGSYYTPDSLVQTLLDSALDPVLDRLEAESEGSPDDAAAGLLTVTIIDPACGSGHFLLAAARRIATRVARLRADGVPTQDDYRRALRDVVRLCIYGVDRNPMAVELSRVALWIETVEPGKPLGFLDANLRCGDSLLGVFSLDALRHGIPEAAYKPLAGDDNAVAKLFAARNKEDIKGQARLGLFGQPASFPIPPALLDQALALRDLPENSEQDIELRVRAFERARANPELTRYDLAADLYTAAFLLSKSKPASKNINPEFPGQPFIPVSSHVWTVLQGGQILGQLVGVARQAASNGRAFHWPLEFPHIFLAKNTEDRGFDVVLGNPPWEVMQLKEEEYFADILPEIASLVGKKRKAAIKTLEANQPEIFKAYQKTRHFIDAVGTFSRSTGRYPLSILGKMNTFSLFTELALEAVSKLGVVALILPTGLATDANSRDLFRSIAHNSRLKSLFAFDNREGLFPAVHRDTSFCLLTAAYVNTPPRFAFELLHPSEAFDERRAYVLSVADMNRMNPNTGSAPVFRSKMDAELSSRIYANVPVFSRDDEDSTDTSLWHPLFLAMFNMASDDDNFRTAAQLQEEGFEKSGANWIEPTSFSTWLPLYEGKMIEHFDHRAGTFEKITLRPPRGASLPSPGSQKKRDPDYNVEAWYWVPQTDVDTIISNSNWPHKWSIGYRFGANPANARTACFSAIPYSAANHIFVQILTPRIMDGRLAAALLGNFNSLTLDYICRQKMSRPGLDIFIIKQLPILKHTSYGETALGFVVRRVLELTYTSHSMASFARDLGYSCGPFRWDEDRRALLRAELDAWYARAYGLSREDLRYILDPADLLGSDYPSETFRVLKKNEINEYGECRTQRLVLDAWDRQAAGDLPASELDRIPQALAALPPVQLTSYAGLLDGAWMNRALFPDRDADAYGALAAIVHALPGPTHQDIVRLAYRYALVPKKLTPLLDDTNRALWLRLVGREAQPNPDNVAEMVATVDAPFGQALRTLRSQRAIVEERATGTWTLGTSVAGLDFTAPLESRARFALDAVRSIGMDRLLGFMQLEEIAWLEQRLA